MILGILSDTHGRVPAMDAGMSALRAAGASAFVHCGDVGGPAVLDALAGEDAAFVFGNSDWDRAELARYASQIGVRCLGAFGELNYGAARIAVMHGDDGLRRQQVVAGQQYEYLLLGHTHVAADQRSGRMRIINPGALFRSSRKTVAILDLAHDRVEFLNIDLP